MSSVYIPVGSMVMIAGLWGRSFTQANTKVSTIPAASIVPILYQLLV